MPPKVRITREDIIRTAVDIVRKDGAGAINARQIAKALNCSTQPVFSNFATMEELRGAVVDAASQLYQACIQQETQSGHYPPYKASGIAYIRFAKEEKELFKLLYMRDRSGEDTSAETETFNQISHWVQQYTGFSEETARLFHLEMWAFVHGIATMVATNYLDLAPELVSDMLTDAYLGLKKRYEEKE